MEPQAIKDLLSQLDALGYFEYDDEEGRAWTLQEALDRGPEGL